MNRKTSTSMISAISVLMSAMLFISVAWVGWDALAASSSDSLYVSMPV